MTKSRDSNNKSPNRTAAGLILMLCLFLGLPLAMAQTGEQPPATAKGFPSTKVLNPAAELWRDVRQRGAPSSGTSQVKGVDSGVLINSYGDRWRKFRLTQLIPIGGYVLGGVLAARAVFYAIRGRVPVEGGLTDRKLLRYTNYERMIHWFIAGIFLFLALTGLILLFGRPLLIPLIGKEAFSAIASACKEGHNLMGPLFL
ncbi:MAG: hypothetical protein P8178_02165, partial [Candidatus Thiodiazotropha sp.]